MRESIYFEPPRGASLEELYAWARELCEILNRTNTEKERGNGNDSI